jgi:hypothetical protein
VTPPPVPPPRAAPFFLPAIGLVVLFAALGPAVGGAVFVPLALMAEAQAQAAAHIGWIAALIGHAVVLIPAYILGLLPAAFTGLAYAFYDAWAPRRAPRAFVAAAIGAVFAHGLYLWLMWAGSAIEGSISSDLGDSVGDFIQDWTAGEFDASLYQALIASGAVSGFVCALVAGLLSLTTRPRPGSAGVSPA